MSRFVSWFQRVVRVYARWRQDDGALLAAAVAYYAALAFFPLVLVLISGLGFVLQYTAWGQDAEQEVLRAIADYASPAVRENVANMLEQVQRKAALGGPLGFAGVVLSAVALFVHFERAFDRIWNVGSPAGQGVLAMAKNLFFKRLRAFLMLLVIGALIIAIFIAGMALSSVKAMTDGQLPFAEWVWWLVEVGVSAALNTTVFTLLYRLLPKVSVHWGEAFRGALFAACLWEFGRLVLAAFILNDKYSAYGIIGSFIAVMLWIYFASSVVFLGAEYVQQICRDCQPEDHPPRVHQSG